MLVRVFYRPKPHGVRPPPYKGGPSVRGKRRGPDRRPLWILLGVGVCVLLAGVGLVAFRSGDQPPSPFTAFPISSATATPSLPATPPMASATIVSATEPVVAALDVPTLQRQMVELINQDRSGAGLPPLLWDSTAAIAGIRHTDDMASLGYFSHWNTEGFGPDYRYSVLAGGLDASQENIFVYRHGSGDVPAVAEDWQGLLRQAERALVASPGHLANILGPDHTHVGIGIAYNAKRGELYIAQEFVNHYLTIEPIERFAPLGTEVILSGHLQPGASDPIINLAYEPLPAALTLADLEATDEYRSPAEQYAVQLVQVDATGAFRHSLRLNHHDRPGLYHIRIAVTTAADIVLAADLIVQVR